MNILVTSAGRRVKIVEYFKRALEPFDGKVITSDCDMNAPAIHFSDGYEIVPRIDHPEYIDIIIDICKKYNINAVISLIDPELELLARNKEKFIQENITLILSPLDSVEITFDKYETYKYLDDKGMPAVPTYNNLIEVKKLIGNKSLSFPLIVKPAKGSASIGLYIVSNEKELNEAYHKHEDQIIQPYYKDKEYGIDVYVDMISGELVDLFIKEKIKMRAGETDKSRSIHNEKVETLIKQMIKKTNFKGPIDIDCFEFNGQFYISEINPRLGGGYPHAYELGCNFMEYILINLQNKKNVSYESYKYHSNIVMMKYDNLKLINETKE
ncbi:ATP-grasp domain-containing protein [Lederbergia sp. NSJ-179]|uniref:ATP-grasp domain-containing protein n=1 Tax=Lederbergia sp. NSJ-179 TaxID=2931402 RepID=UPI001FD3B42D|nr:ATP-grasp domain-containing protein [Lederbergia sp. NSJ-179]MCJ7840672.1 ATP-grasp domain-containing protein [Lederbergia sp. NSJ-179]